jgi:hypothetical protein
MNPIKMDKIVDMRCTSRQNELLIHEIDSQLTETLFEFLRPPLTSYGPLSSHLPGGDLPVRCLTTTMRAELAVNKEIKLTNLSRK